VRLLARESTAALFASLRCGFGAGWAPGRQPPPLFLGYTNAIDIEADFVHPNHPSHDPCPPSPTLRVDMSVKDKNLHHGASSQLLHPPSIQYFMPKYRMVTLANSS
jgi:hypothetical protein